MAGACTFFWPEPPREIMSPDESALQAVAGLMALAARTAPKGRGVDTIEVRVLSKKEKRALASRLDALGTERGIGFFHRDAKNIAAASACILIGSRAGAVAGIDCGGCGFASCASFERARAKKKPGSAPYDGPNCILRVTDLGIAVGSAVKTAQIHNADNRVMYSGGVAARDLGLLPAECTIAYVIPLSATGKNIFFDR